MALRVAVVLSVAVAAGHVVQMIRPANGVAASANDPTLEADPLLPELAGITAVSAASPAQDPDCSLELDLEALPGAMIGLTLLAPCNMGERVVIRHSGLAFAETVGATGQLRTQFPAMEAQATVAAFVGSSDIVMAEIAVPEVADYLRLSVQMPSTARFDLRAEEDGQLFVAKLAGPEGASHRVTVLGHARTDDPMMSQIYSVAIVDLANPVLTLELSITPEICGRTLVAEIALSRQGRVTESSSSVQVPLCGEAGDILLLKNLLPDLTLATLH